MQRNADKFKILNGKLLHTKKDKKVVNNIIKYFPTHLYYQVICRLDTLQMQKNKSRFWKDVIKIQLLVTWVKRTLTRITERFIWPGVAKGVHSMVSRFTDTLKLIWI